MPQALDQGIFLNPQSIIAPRFHDCELLTQIISFPLQKDALKD